MNEPTSLSIGIDLGTTNSAVACFDGEQAKVLADAKGAQLVPSVVSILPDGTPICGHNAEKRLLSDPENTRAGHKRMMGSPSRFEFPESGRVLGPEALATVVLEHLCQRVEAETGRRPQSAVISIPALFELPQAEATARAARNAGLERVELVQEPVAAALAAGWRAGEGSESSEGYWLVYDLGGGTFDATLLEGSEGFLRVVSHAGDPFLGGRDLDAAIARWVCAQQGTAPAQLIPSAWRALKRSCERAKIRLQEVECTPLELEGLFDVGARCSLDRARVETLLAPLVERSLGIVRKLLREQELNAGQLARLVFVGGPTVMSSLRTQVTSALGVPCAQGVDPMTAVACGAAIFAATNGLTMNEEREPQQAANHSEACELWLRHPALTSDLEPHVVGRVEDLARFAAARFVVATRDDGLRIEAPVDTEGNFSLETRLCAQRKNHFRLEAKDARGRGIQVHPAAFSISHGLTIDEPPLGASVGVALANDHVKVYFERGTPLPARRVFRHRTVEHLHRGSQLRIPIVQGEYDRAHLCRPVGAIEVAVQRSEHKLPAGSEIEISLELDRGGRMSARARLPGGLGVIDRVERLMVPAADPDTLVEVATRMRERVNELRGRAFREGSALAVDGLDGLESELRELDELISEACAGDFEAGENARRRGLELEARLDAWDEGSRLRELESQARSTLAWANTWVSLRGTPRESALLEEVAGAMEAARRRADGVDLQSQTRIAAQLGEAAWLRDPTAWAMLFERFCSELDDSVDLPKANALVDRGRVALEREDWAGLRSVVDRLRPLLPARASTRRLAHGSGVR